MRFTVYLWSSQPVAAQDRAYGGTKSVRPGEGGSHRRLKIQVLLAVAQTGLDVFCLEPLPLTTR